MSKHRIPLTPIEEAGLRAHGLGHYIGKPSQLADVFRDGVAWGIESRPANPQPAGQVPAGYMLVPVEPTQEMLPQAWLIAQRGGIDQEGLMTHDRLRQIYRAMIAAAPTASLAQEVPTWKDRLNGKRDPADIMLCMQDEIEELRAALGMKGSV